MPPFLRNRAAEDISLGGLDQTLSDISAFLQPSPFNAQLDDKQGMVALSLGHPYAVLRIELFY